jgi:hypothetical protein
MNILSWFSDLAIHGSKNSNLAIVSNRYFRDYNLVLKRLSNMFNGAGIEGNFHKGLWAECASTATFYENIIVKNSHCKSPWKLMFKEKAKEFNSL